MVLAIYFAIVILSFTFIQFSLISHLKLTYRTGVKTSELINRQLIYSETLWSMLLEEIIKETEFSIYESVKLNNPIPSIEKNIDNTLMLFNDNLAELRGILNLEIYSDFTNIYEPYFEKSSSKYGVRGLHSQLINFLYTIIAYKSQKFNEDSIKNIIELEASTLELASSLNDFNNIVLEAIKEMLISQENQAIYTVVGFIVFSLIYFILLIRPLLKRIKHTLHSTFYFIRISKLSV